MGDVDGFDPDGGDAVGNDHDFGTDRFGRRRDRFDRVAESAGGLGDLDRQRIDGRIGFEGGGDLFNGRRGVPPVGQHRVGDAVGFGDFAEPLAEFAGVDGEKARRRQVGDGRLHGARPRGCEHHDFIGAEEVEKECAGPFEDRFELRGAVVDGLAGHRHTNGFGNRGRSGRKE